MAIEGKRKNESNGLELQGKATRAISGGEHHRVASDYSPPFFPLQILRAR